MTNEKPGILHPASHEWTEGSISVKQLSIIGDMMLKLQSSFRNQS